MLLLVQNAATMYDIKEISTKQFSSLFPRSKPKESNHTIYKSKMFLKSNFTAEKRYVKEQPLSDPGGCVWNMLFSNHNRSVQNVQNSTKLLSNIDVHVIAN